MRVILASVFAIVIGTSIFAQSPTGTISGIVFDADAKTIRGAEIIVVNDLTRVQYETKTNDIGLYVVPNLPPGPYRVQASKAGFKTLIKPDIIVNVQDAVTINFILPVGATSIAITVEGGAPLVNTESASVSTVIGREFVENLPLNGRSFNTLLQLTPGVIIAPSSYNSPGQFSVAGQRTDANNFTVDGISANFGITAGQGASASGTGGIQAFSALGGTSSLVSVEALQEFRIETSSFAPEFGKTPGGQISLTTRSGTAEFHGGVYDYFRNSVMDANDWFANQAGNPRAREEHNDFGGYLGGPIWKRKTFFFFSYEGARLRLPQTSVIQVPSDAVRASASSTLAPFLNAYPQPRGPVSSAGDTAQFTGTYSNTGILDATSIRIDHKFNDKFSLFGRYNYAPSQTTDRVFSLSNVETAEANTQTLTVGLNVLLSGLANTLRGNYSSQNALLTDSLDNFGGSVPISPSLFVGSFPAQGTHVAFLALNATDYFVGPNSKNETKQMNFADDATLLRGAHQLKFGGDYRDIFADFKSATHDVYLIAPSVQSFVTTGQANLSTVTFAPSRVLSQSLSLYAQDNWKITPRLNLVYGVRWELSPAPEGLGSTHLVAWNNVSTPAELAMAPRGTPVWGTGYGNFAPRLGIAYRPTRGGDFVLRVGAGIFYDLGVASVGVLANAFPNSGSQFTPNVSVPVNDVTPFLPSLSANPPYPNGVYAFDPNLKLPRSYQWNVALDKSFWGSHAISVTYAGQAGRDLLRQEAIFRPNADFLGDLKLTGNTARSNYNSLQVQYRKPLSSHVQALFNYTWSHSLDNASSDVVSALGSVLSGKNDYASSDFDVRQSFSGAFTVGFPTAAKSGFVSLLTKDWFADSVIVARTGFPFNAVVLFASPDPGGSAESRPDRVVGQPLWLPSATAAGGRILNSAAFSIPSPTRQGSEGRNDIAGFGLTQLDFSVRRKFPITERINLQFRADAFNLLNHPNFANPQAFVEFGPFYLQSEHMLNQTLGGLNPLFQQGGPRSLQISLKLTF